MIKVGIIVGSTRPGRIGEAVARWVDEQGKKFHDAQFEIVDIKDYNLPLLDEPVPAAFGQYTKDHTKAWSEKIASLDGFIFVTGEYNHSTTGALKNAIDFLYSEWNNKSAGFVSYGANGGSRAVEHLRQIAANLQIADVRAQVQLSLFTDFENLTEFKPAEMHEKDLHSLFEQVVSWGNALKPLHK